MKIRPLFISVLFLCLAVPALAQLGEVQFSKLSKSADGSTEFKSGEYIFAHVQFKQPVVSSLTLNDRPVTFATEFYKDGKLLEEEMFGFDVDKVKSSKIDKLVIPVISDPAGDVPTWGKNLFAFRLPAVLADLPAGTHEIEFKLKSYNYKDAGEVMASGKFTLVTDAGARAWYKANEKDSYTALSQRGVTAVVVSERDAALGVVGGKSVVTLVNNCGRSVWMRKSGSSDKREYRLAPGQEMKYDRDGGYLEEWNFGTKKWTTVTKVFAPNAAGKANICK